jgi:hypothetical protein
MPPWHRQFIIVLKTGICYQRILKCCATEILFFIGLYSNKNKICVHFIVIFIFIEFIVMDSWCPHIFFFFFFIISLKLLFRLHLLFIHYDWWAYTTLIKAEYDLFPYCHDRSLPIGNVLLTNFLRKKFTVELFSTKLDTINAMLHISVVINFCWRFCCFQGERDMTNGLLTWQKSLYFMLIAKIVLLQIWIMKNNKCLVSLNY